MASNDIIEINTDVLVSRRLHYIDLSENKLEHLPTDWFIPALEQAYLGGNELYFLSSKFWRSENLAILDLSDNQFSTIPREVCKLKELVALDLSNNQLTQIPLRIKRLKKLEKLDLRGNKIELEDLERLENLMPGCEVLYDTLVRD